MKVLLNIYQCHHRMLMEVLVTTEVLLNLQAVSDAKGGTVYRDHLPHLGESGGGGSGGGVGVGGVVGAAAAAATSATPAAPVAVGSFHPKKI